MEFDIKTIEKTARFFKLRFPEKDLIFEMECGYFFEWCDRFENKNVKQYCDQESLKAVLKLERDE